MGSRVALAYEVLRVILYLDIESYSELPIKHGAFRYAEEVELLLIQWAVDDAPVQVREPNHIGVLEILIGKADRIVVHNAGFERTVLPRLRERGVELPIGKVWDTMAQARAHGLPGALGALCDVLGVPVDKAKDKAGKQLIQLFCKPRPKNATIRRATKDTHPEEWAKFVAYGGLDVEAMREVYKRLPSWNCTGFERELWELDQRINERGFAVDLDLARAAIETVAREQAKLKQRVNALTHGEVQAATQRDAMLRHLLEQYGIELPDFQKGTLERRLEDPELPEPVRELLRIRLEAATTSTSKYQALLNAVSSDGRLRGALAYCGAARTGRWSGRLFQPQNLPRPKHKPAEIAESIDAITAGAADLLYDDVIDRASSAIRGAIVAGGGRKLVAADLSNIEGRVLAWLAGESWKLDAFRAYDEGTGPDLYVLGYSRSFNVAIEAVAKDQRQVGKVQELALGYQGAVGAFSSMAALYGVDLPEAQVLAIVRAWRRANPRIVDLWYALETQARYAIQHPGETLTLGRLRLRRDGNWLRIALPSKRCLCYPSPHADEDGKLSYMGMNQYTRKWERILTYGGKLAENVTQATARDVLADAMVRAEREGFPIVLTVHDELVTEPVDDTRFSAGRLEQILSTNPAWADGLPLAAEGFEAYRYGK